MKYKPTSRSEIPAKKSARMPAVGIFFLVADKLFIDRTPVSKGQTWGDFRIHERGHDVYWEMLRQARAVPQQSEYDDYPRGRVAYDTKTRRYLLFLDRCILKKKSLVNKIMSELNLPKQGTKKDTDSHYRCPQCLRKD